MFYLHWLPLRFSLQVVQKLIPQLDTIENILNILLHNCKFEKLFLFDVLSKVQFVLCACLFESLINPQKVPIYY